MAKIDLLDRYPRSGHALKLRATVTENDRQIAGLFGREYFDGPRRLGYGGYTYDPRFWTGTVQRFRDHYDLPDNAAILDVGCAKGLMLHDFGVLMPEAQLAGVDISKYAIESAIDDMKPFLQVASAADLPFEDDTFDLVVSISTLHNLPELECFRAVQEIERVSKRHSFIMVGAYSNLEEKRRQEIWNLTQLTSFSTDEWESFFDRAGYTGDHYWFMPQAAPDQDT